MGEITRFESYKKHHASPLITGDCGIGAVLARFHDATHWAMDELAAKCDRKNEWTRITKRAERLLNTMPKDAGRESVLAVFLFLTSLDQGNAKTEVTR